MRGLDTMPMPASINASQHVGQRHRVDRSTAAKVDDSGIASAFV